MMEVRLLLVLVLALTLTGSDAQSDVCGVAPLNSLTRIVGGDEAAVGAWPWQVVVHDNTLFCGGSLITNQWVLTAASCVPSLSLSGLSVTLGTNTLDPLSSTSVILSVSKKVLHPIYSSLTLNHNIALLQLSSPVNFTDYVRPVCLASENSVFDVGTTMWTTGWGYIYTGVDIPAPYWLQQVTVPVVSNQECDRIYSDEVTDDMLCAGGQSERGPCNGDGGGPLVLKSGSQWVQAGVVSFWSTKGCAQGNIPAVFTRVSRYRQWISSTIVGDQPGFIKAGSPGLAPVTLLLGAAFVLSSVLVHS